MIFCKKIDNSMQDDNFQEYRQQLTNNNVQDDSLQPGSMVQFAKWQFAK